MGELVYRPKLRIQHQSPWVHRGTVEGLEAPLLMGKHGALKERFMARYPDRPQVQSEDEHPTSQDYLAFAVGG